MISGQQIHLEQQSKQHTRKDTIKQYVRHCVISVYLPGVVDLREISLLIESWFKIVIVTYYSFILFSDIDVMKRNKI